jgi:DNA replication protein DnaC
MISTETPSTPPSPTLDPIRAGLAELKLKHWQVSLEKDWPAIKPAEQERLAMSLGKWIQFEISSRHTVAIQRRIRDAKFIREQSVDQYDFQYNASTRTIERDYLKLHQQARDGNLPRAVFVGNTGLGKTHLARSLGYASCQAGIGVIFTKASEIVNDLSTAKAVHNLERALRRYRKPQLLIVDELGYVSMDTEAGQLFFQVISDRHDRGLGTIVTTNYAFGHWNQIFASESTALVIVERLTADAEVFYLEGESYPQYQKRMKASSKK